MFFLAEWANHVNLTMVSKDLLPWFELPGYIILLKVAEGVLAGIGEGELDFYFLGLFI